MKTYASASRTPVSYWTDRRQTNRGPSGSAIKHHRRVVGPLHHDHSNPNHRKSFLLIVGPRHVQLRSPFDRFLMSRHGQRKIGWTSWFLTEPPRGSIRVSFCGSSYLRWRSPKLRTVKLIVVKVGDLGVKSLPRQHQGWDPWSIWPKLHRKTTPCWRLKTEDASLLLLGMQWLSHDEKGGDQNLNRSWCVVLNGLN